MNLKTTIIAVIATGLIAGLAAPKPVASQEPPSDQSVSPVQIRYDLQKGWNLVSLPVLAEDMRLSRLFSAALGCLAYEPGEGYMVSTDLVAGRGYWVYLPERAEVLIEGQPVAELHVEVSTGWHLIGGGRTPLDVNELKTASGGRLLLAFGYDLSYREVNSLQPGKGYWIFWFDPSGEEAVLDLSGAAAKLPVWTPPEFGPPWALSDVQWGPNTETWMPPAPPSRKLEAQTSADHPRGFALEQNFPNPFNPSTTIRYAVAEVGRVHLRIYSPTGQLVRLLVDQWQPAGSYQVEWDGRNGGGWEAGNGVYLYELRMGNRQFRRKMLLLR